MGNIFQDKLTHASGAVGRLYTKIGARVDAIIEREARIEQLTEDSFSPHEALLSQAEQGLTDLPKALEIMNRGDNSPLLDTSQPHADNSLVTDMNGKVAG